MGKLPNEKKDGVSVHQIENFGKNHSLEIFFCLTFILSSFCSFLFYGPSWSIYALGIGGVVSSCFSKHISKLILMLFNFCISQQRVTKIVIASVCLVLAIFIAPLVFLFFGLVAGKSLYHCAKNCTKGSCCSRDDHDHHEI